jgi:hypothetical protein
MVSHALSNTTEEGHVKLGASLFCVAALSLAGCAEEVTPTGGIGEGIYPYKLAVQNPESVSSFGLEDITKLQGVKVGETVPADVVCDGCVMDTYRVIDVDAIVDEIRVVGDPDGEVCRIYVGKDQVIFDDCGFANP